MALCSLGLVVPEPQAAFNQNYFHVGKPLIELPTPQQLASALKGSHSDSEHSNA